MLCSLLLPLLVLSLPTLSSALVLGPRVCADGSAGELVSTQHVAGAPLTVLACKVDGQGSGETEARELRGRAFDLVGAPCTTHCNGTSGGGPNPHDCSTLADADATGGKLSISAGYVLVWTYRSCQVTMSNDLSPKDELVYDYGQKSWAGVVRYVAWNFQAAQNAHGGTCDFYNNHSVSSIVVKHS